MQTLQVKVQDLNQEVEEERLMNLQYQCTQETLVTKNKELKTVVSQLTNKNKELTDKLNHLEAKERGQKRKLNENEENNLNSMSKRTTEQPSNKSPDTSSTSDADKSHAEDSLLKLRQNNAKLLTEKEEMRKRFENQNAKLLVERDEALSRLRHCYDHYNMKKKELETTKKDYDEIRNKKVSELAKDPRLSSLMEKDQTSVINQLKEELVAAQKLNKIYVPNDTNLLDASKLKKERTESSSEIEQSSKDKQPSSSEYQKQLQTLMKSNKVLEMSLKNKESELKIKVEELNVLKSQLEKKETELKTITEQNQRYCEFLNKSKDKLKTQKESLEQMTAAQTEMEKTIASKQNRIVELELLNEKELDEAKQSFKKLEQQIIKDLEHKHGLETLKLRNSYEQEINALKTEMKGLLEGSKRLSESEASASSKEQEIETLKKENEKINRELDFQKAETSRYKLLMANYQEESQKHTSQTNTLNRQLDDYKERYQLLQENCRLYKEKQHHLEGMLEKLLQERSILLANARLANSQMNPSPAHSPHHVSLQQQQQQNPQMILMQQQNAMRTAGPQQLPDSASSSPLLQQQQQQQHPQQQQQQPQQHLAGSPTVSHLNPTNLGMNVNHAFISTNSDLPPSYNMHQLSHQQQQQIFIHQQQQQQLLNRAMPQNMVPNFNSPNNQATNDKIMAKPIIQPQEPTKKQ